MEVLLLQDVPGIGKKNDLLVVGDGFAMNFLLPKRAALVATPLVRKRYAEFIRRRAEERESEKAAAAGMAQSLSGKGLTFTKKATKTGKLYAAITEKNIADALKDEHGMVVAEDDIEISDQIKSTGMFQVTVTVSGQNLPLTVTVDAEK